MSTLTEIRIWWLPHWRALRSFYWTRHAERAVARKRRARERERHLRITRQLTASIATTTLSTGNAKHRKWSLGR